jgi:hypothetical protein
MWRRGMSGVSSLLLSRGRELVDVHNSSQGLKELSERVPAVHRINYALAKLK